MYGTTSAGGTAGRGTIFRLTPSGTLATLHSFTGSGGDGSQPSAPLILGSDGFFYGTTAYGGTRNSGTVFRMTPQGAWTNLHSFTYGSDGALPWAALVLGTDGNFYGTTYNGGAFGYGTVFCITPDGTFTTLYSFSNGSDGGQPYAALVQGDNGNFYGTTHGSSNLYADTNSIGTVFEITPWGWLTTLYSFTNGLDGANPSAGLVLARDGTFYGAAKSGGIIGWGGSIGQMGRILAGTQGWGTLFSLTQDGQFTPLYAFGGESPSANPGAGLIQATNGLFYGVSERGGSHDDGTVFQMAADGTVTTLYSFTAGNDGAVPIAALVQGNDGNFYGTTYEGGISNAGAVFKITAAGTLSTLHTFTNGTDGGRPYAALLQGTNGSFYGTTPTGGGKNGYGTVFQITPAGVLTTLHTFTNGGDGSAPIAGLVQGPDGLLYGAAHSGGTNGNGTIFQMSTTGTFRVLYSFRGTNDGAGPSATLTLGPDGHLYGVCENSNGGNGYGTVFRITRSGLLTPLHAFNGTNDGAYPESPLVLATDGRLYGTTSSAADGYGTAFQITTNGVFATLHSFTWQESGPQSYTALVQGTNGSLYIACEGSGWGYNPGTVLRLIIAPVFQSVTNTGANWNFSWNGQTGQKYQIQWNASLEPGSWVNLGAPLTGSGPTLHGSDVNPAGTRRFYRVVAVP